MSNEPWPVAKKQRRIIVQYAVNIKWDVGFDAWLLSRHRRTSIERIADWSEAQRVINGLRGLCMAQHKCRACDAPCKAWMRRYQ